MRMTMVATSARWRRKPYAGVGIWGETFRDRLLALVDKAKGIKPRERRKADGLEKDYGERDAGRMIG